MWEVPMERSHKGIEAEAWSANTDNPTYFQATKKNVNKHKICLVISKRSRLVRKRTEPKIPVFIPKSIFRSDKYLAAFSKLGNDVDLHAALLQNLTKQKEN
jgi:hypothetical protein